MHQRKFIALWVLALLFVTLSEAGIAAGADEGAKKSEPFRKLKCGEIIMGNSMNEPSGQLVQFSGVYFYRYGEVNNSAPMILIPGGPWISGRYMDEFAESIHARTGITTYRAVLPNHEVDAGGPAQNLDFNGLVSRIATGIHGVQAAHVSAPLLLGHSFGSIIAADLVGSGVVDAKKVVLISTPVSFTGWTKLNKKMLENGIPSYDSVIDNESFKKWWKLAVTQYFALEPGTQDLSMLSADTYMTANTNMSSHMSDAIQILQGLARVIQRNKVGLLIIEGNSDPIGPENNSEVLKNLFSNSVQTINNSGHFPFLENNVVTLERIVYSLTQINGG